MNETTALIGDAACLVVNGIACVFLLLVILKFRKEQEKVNHYPEPEPEGEEYNEGRAFSYGHYS